MYLSFILFAIGLLLLNQVCRGNGMTRTFT